MTEQTEQTAPFWRPSQESARNMMLFLAVFVALIGAIALSLSFYSIDVAARPFFGGASWSVPVLIDVALAGLTFFSIVAELNKLRAPLARYFSRVLIAVTIYANVAPQHSVYGKVLHGAPPVVWVVIVGIAESLVRRLARLGDKRQIEPMRRSLWLLRPASTWRIWRQMRIHQITTYAAALDRDAARAAVTGRLRLHHGRMWRAKAPLSERIALRLQGRDPSGVAASLAAHADTAALLAAPTGRSPEPAETATEPASDSTLRPLDPIVYPLGERPVLVPFPPLAVPFQAALNALPSGRVPAPRENEPGNGAENDEDERETALRLYREGLSYGQIGDRLGRSKSWAYRAVNQRPIEHANGSAN